MCFDVKINGRSYFVNSEVCEIVDDGAGRYYVEYDKTNFMVIGGRKSGGGSREWYVQNKMFFGDQMLRCNSMIEAVRKGIQY